MSQPTSSTQRADWLGVFGLWLAARFRYEFADSDWIYQVHDGAGRVTAYPREPETPKVAWKLPNGYLERPPYVVAAQAAAELRVKAEAMGAVPQRRTIAPQLFNTPPGVMSAIDRPSESNGAS